MSATGAGACGLAAGGRYWSLSRETRVFAWGRQWSGALACGNSVLAGWRGDWYAWAMVVMGDCDAQGN